MNTVLLTRKASHHQKLCHPPGWSTSRTSRPQSLLDTTHLRKMASLTLRRPNWCLHISRSTRTFAVSFTTSLGPRSQATRRLPHGASSSFRSARQTAYNTNTSPLRAAFTSSSQAQAEEAANPTSKPPARYTPSTKPTYNNASPPTSNPNPYRKDTQDLSEGLSDQPLVLDEGDRQIDWARSFHGLSAEPFAKEAADTLLTPIPFEDVEIKSDGIIYLPEIKYRRILNKAFGPGGWGLAPRGETIVTAKAVTREYALLAHGRSVSLGRCFNNIASAKVRTQTCFCGSWRDGLFLFRGHSHRGRRLQIQRHDALLQGPGCCERALGSTIHPEVQDRSCKRSLRRACADKEAEEDMVTEGRQT